MQEENWRPVTEGDPLVNAPPSVSALIMKCMAADPAIRPSFSSILDTLSGLCKARCASSQWKVAIMVMERTANALDL